MQNLLLVRYGEIFLKGLNRPYFIRALVRKVRYAVRGMGAEVWVHDGRIFVKGFSDLDECISRVTKVFGVHSVCPAVEMPKEDFEAICTQAVEMAKDLKGTFKVNARRADKRYPMNSMAINEEVGYRILQANPDLKVDVHNPEHLVNIEIRDMAYLYVKVIPAVGGMPVGTNGNATLLLSGGIDSPVSTYLIAKRGVRLVPVHFFSFPYTSELAKEKVISLAKLLEPYTGRMTLQIVPFTHIQEEIRRLCPEEYFTLIMRRFMMRIAEDIARHNDCKAIVTGENLGQVASQTMEAMASTQSVIDLPVLQPLVGMDKTDIIAHARRIGTFETAILPYEDCCTVFTPRHPKPRPTVAEVAEAESVMDIDGLVQEAIAGIERIKIGYEC